jgi:hypothetical protein
MRVLRTLRDLDLPDWTVFSGAVYQPVLNHLTGRAADYGVKDYDLGLLPATLRPNGGFERAAARAASRWPELAVAGK